MAVLNVVIPYFFICQSFVGFGQLNEALVEGLDGLILRGIRADFVGMVNERKTFVVSGDGFFVRALEKGSQLAIIRTIRSCETSVYRVGTYFIPLRYPEFRMDPRSWARFAQ